MTKLTEAVYATRSVKKFNNYLPNPYKYKLSLPPILKDSVSNKGETSNKATCIQEMSVMMACWKKYEFDQTSTLCSKEIQEFNKCTTETKIAVKNLKEAIRTGKTVEGSNRQPSSQVNKLLNRYPQPKSKFILKW